MKKRIFAGITAICILLSAFGAFAVADGDDVFCVYNQTEQQVLENAPEISCTAACLFEPVSGKILYDKSAHEAMYPASTTKILTALLVIENCELDEKVTVSKSAIDAAPYGGTSARLEAGEEFTVRTLLEAMLIPSGNEAANALAEYVSGSIEEFAKLSNQRAKELGCETLHFVNPSGLHDDSHYCSAYDLCLIARECQKHEAFNSIVKSTACEIPATDVHPKDDRKLVNTNSMILPGAKNYYYKYCTGMKTGFTTPAGKCLVASSTKDGVDLICTVFGGYVNAQGISVRFVDAKNLFEFGYKNYFMHTIVYTGNIVDTVTVRKGNSETAIVDALAEATVTTCLPNGYDVESIERVVTMNEGLRAPIAEDEVIGQVTYKADGLSYTVNLVASHKVTKLPYWLFNLIVALVAAIISAIIAYIVIRKKRKDIS